jgi:sortase A
VMYPNGIEPGQPGLAFISGHSTGESWHGAYRFAFLRLHELQPGDVIHVDYNGSRYTYRVTGTRTINPKVVQSIDATADTPLLSLMTCWPLWSTRNRLIVDSEFIARNPLIIASDTNIDSI